MKKQHISFLFLLITCISFLNYGSYDSIKMSLILNKNKEEWGNGIINKEVAEYIKTLKKLSEVQKKRKLTIEELNFAYYAFIHIFTELYENYSSKIIISINDKDNLNLPFSSDILINLISNILQEDNILEKNQKNEL